MKCHPHCNMSVFPSGKFEDIEYLCGRNFSLYYFFKMQGRTRLLYLTVLETVISATTICHTFFLVRSLVSLFTQISCIKKHTIAIMCFNFMCIKLSAVNVVSIDKPCWFADTAAFFHVLKVDLY